MSSHILDEQISFFKSHYDNADPNSDSLTKLLYVDTRTLLPDNLLMFNDKLTMANSIENRVPYLDIDLINFIESLPIKFKLRGSVGKYIHKQAAKMWLPNEIINRKKRGFETPVSEWFKTQLGDSLLQLTKSSDSLSALYLNANFIEEMITLHKKKRKDYSKHLFIILSLELWFRSAKELSVSTN
jgi:asparagine synthase (glutamine-hydrolysing)